MKYFNRTLLIISIILLIYTIIINVIFGNIAFSKVIGIVCILGIIYGIIQIRHNDQLLLLLPKGLRYFLYGGFILAFTLFVMVEGIILYGAFHKDQIQADKVVVLGAQIKGDVITSSLLYRLDTTIEYYQQYPNTTIIVSGGQGKGENTTEAYAMAQYLISKGIPQEKIIQEDQSTNTYENFEFSSQYIEPDDSIMVITNSFHMSRAKLIASRLGLETYGYGAPSHLPTIINFYIREFFAYIKDFMLTK